MKLALLVLLCALLATAAWASPSLRDLDDSIALLETQASADPVDGADVALKAAESYASDKVAAATAEGKTLLASAAKAGEAEAAKADASLPDVDPKTAAAVAAAGADAAKVLASTAAAAAGAAAAVNANPSAAAQAIANRMRGKGLQKDALGIYGAVVLGVSKADSAPNAGTPAAAAAAAAAAATAAAQKTACLDDVEDGDKNLYGQQKSFLKDIAAHFDERDIFETKKARLEARLKDTTDRQVAYALRMKLLNLETWHQMMQKKFLMSSLEAKEHAKKVEALFDAHLPKELKDQLAANKVATKAGQKIPFPEAHKKAIAYMKSIKTKLARTARLKGLGHKVMVRPEIDNPTFPSVDPISASLRERRWRQVALDDNLSTDRDEMEAASKLVGVSHKQHGDFMDGPIAEPLLRGKLYNAKTEPLGVPNFLTNFPWPHHPDETVSMDEKVKVEQTDFTTY